MGKRFYSISLKFCRKATFGRKPSRAWISLPAFRVRHTSMPVQNGRKITPYLASKTSVTAEHRNGIQTKRHHTNIYFPLYSPKIGRTLHFVKEPGDDSPKQLSFKAKIAQFQPHFLHLMQSQVLHSKQS